VIDRLAPTRRPEGKAAGFQKWRNLLFVHYALDAEIVRALVPPSLELDLWEGQAHVGLVPFEMKDIRSAWMPRPSALNFLETNVRTYVHKNGEPGVFFFSLEASSWLAVQVARTGWGLPYFHATMSTDGQGTYCTRPCKADAPCPDGFTCDEGDLGGVVEVVDDDDAEALLQQLQHRVAADVPGTTRHQDGPEHGGGHHRRPLPYFLLPTFLPSSDGIGMPRLAC